MGPTYLFERRARLRRRLWACIFSAGMLLAMTSLAREAPPASQQPASSTTDAQELGLELNKLEQRGDDCVIWTLLKNPSDTDFASLKLDLVLFGKDGLIERRLALDAAPLPAAKTMVKVFKMPAMMCDSLGRILVNDIVACAGKDGPIEDCLKRLHPSSRGSVELIK